MAKIPPIKIDDDLAEKSKQKAIKENRSWSQHIRELLKDDVKCDR